MRNGWWLQQRRRVVGLARQSPERAGHSHRVVPPLQETPVICAQVPLRFANPTLKQQQVRVLVMALAVAGVEL